MKKSQVTLFIIFGIIILAIFGFIYYAISGIQLNNSSNTPVDRYMKECLSMEGKYIFAELGYTAGKFKNSTYNTSYVMHGSSVDLPSIKEINSNLKKEFNRSIKRCINNYFGHENITRLKPEYNFVYSQDSVNINIKKPYKVKTFQKSTYKDIVPITVNVRLKYLLNLINHTLQDFALDGYVYENYLLKDPYVDVYIKQNGSDRLWIVRDHLSSEYEEPYFFRFAVEK
ncbi:MAG: hypothetical protein ACQESF_01775 [Nanobdellota archaeon]